MTKMNWKSKLQKIPEWEYDLSTLPQEKAIQNMMVVFILCKTRFFPCLKQCNPGKRFWRSLGSNYLVPGSVGATPVGTGYLLLGTLVLVLLKLLCRNQVRARRTVHHSLNALLRDVSVQIPSLEHLATFIGTLHRHETTLRLHVALQDNVCLRVLKEFRGVGEGAGYSQQHFWLRPPTDIREWSWSTCTSGPRSRGWWRCPGTSCPSLSASDIPGISEKPWNHHSVFSFLEKMDIFQAYISLINIFA